MLDYLARNHNQIKKLLLLALLLSLVPFLLLTLFSHPAFDDWNYALTVLNRGFIGAQAESYNRWTGRYFSTAVVSFNPLALESFAAYKAVGLLIISLTFVSILCFLNALLKSSVTRIDKLVATAFLTALFSNQTPDVTEAYFWMTGAVTYQLGCILTLFFLTSVIRSDESAGIVRLLLFLAAGVLIVAIVGSNETLMLILAVLVIPITVRQLMNKTKDRWIWLAYTMITISSALIVIAAPGNAIRNSYFPGRHRFFYSLGMSFLQETRFLLTWISNASFVLGTLFFIPIASKLSERIRIPKSLRGHPLIPSLWLLILVFLGFFPVYWSTGLLGQLRTVNTVYFFFLIGWFINIVIWVNYLKQERGLRLSSLPKYAYVIGVPLLLFSLFSLNNTGTAIADLLTLRAYHYDIAVRERYAQFEQCARAGHDDNCPTLTISDLPTTITNPYFETEFESEKQFWKLRTASSGSR
jgi:hypothetical protein